MTLLLAEKVRQFTCYWRTIHVMLGLQSRDHAKKRKENTSWSQATFVYFRAMPPRHLTPALVACRCHPPPLRVVAPSADYEYLMFLGARCSCGQYILLYHIFILCNYRYLLLLYLIQFNDTKIT